MNGYVLVPPSNHISERHYQWELEATNHAVAEAPTWLLEFSTCSNNSMAADRIGPLVSTFAENLSSHGGARQGARNDTLCRLIGKYLAEYGPTNDLLPCTLVWATRCQPPLNDKQVRRTVASLIEKHGQQTAERARLLSQSPPWPESVDQAAFHGLAGEIVRTIKPHSEADPVAIFFKILVAFGNAIGRPILWLRAIVVFESFSWR